MRKNDISYQSETAGQYPANDENRERNQVNALQHGKAERRMDSLRMYIIEELV